MASDLKLLHLTTVPETLGFLRGQVGFMKEHGFEVEAVASPGPALDLFGRVENITVHALPLSRAISPWADLIALFKLTRLLGQSRPAIVHAHTPKGGLIGMLGAWLARVPVRIYHIHGFPYLTATGVRRLLLKWSERVSCRLAHRVLCVSHSVRQLAVTERICSANLVKVLSSGSINGVDAHVRFNPHRYDPNTRAAVRAREGVPDDAFGVGFIGRLVRDKGIVELAHAWRELRHDIPHAHLLLVGPIEPRDPVPAEIIAEMRADPRIHLVGPADPAEYLLAMDVLVLPTYREGFPNVPLEAAAMSLPVVTTTVPGAIDAVLHDITGTLIAAGDVPALKGAILRYASDSRLRRAHGEAGRAWVLSEFAQERIWNAGLCEYAELLNDRKIEHGLLHQS